MATNWIHFHASDTFNRYLYIFTIFDIYLLSILYITPLAKIVGETGKIFALDIHPLAVQKVQRIASVKKIPNIETIQSDCHTGLPDESIDIVLLYDILHELSKPEKIFKELHRILKTDGTLSCSDHHLGDSEIKSKVTNSGLFKLKKKGQKTFSFVKMG